MKRSPPFWESVDRPSASACWLWQGHTAPNGYGKTGGKTLAHRMAYMLFYGPIPRGLWICHRCDVRACCNPAHLFLGTPKENHADMVAKGRKGITKWRNGEDNVTSVLKAVQVVEIIQRARAGETNLSIAKRFGITNTNVGYIVNGKTWRGVPEVQAARMSDIL